MFGFRSRIRRALKKTIENELNLSERSNHLQNQINILKEKIDSLERQAHQVSGQFSSIDLLDWMPEDTEGQMPIAIEPRSCSAQECNAPHYRSNYCLPHYNEWLSNGMMA